MNLYRRTIFFLSMSLTNSTILGAMYMSFGLVVELVRRWAGPRWAEKAASALDTFPSQILAATGLLNGLRQHFLAGDLTVWHLRLIYGVVTLAIILSVGAIVGLGMAVAFTFFDEDPNSSGT